MSSSKLVLLSPHAVTPRRSHGVPKYPNNRRKDTRLWDDGLLSFTTVNWALPTFYTFTSPLVRDPHSHYPTTSSPVCDCLNTHLHRAALWRSLCTAIRRNLTKQGKSIVYTKYLLQLRL